MRVVSSGTENGQVGTGRKTRFAQLLFEQPRGLYLVSITEFWERFSYWGMLGLLVLFLTATPANGGFGWSNSDAIKLYALYTGAVFSAPAIGGYVASRFWGERRCILWGGISVTVGHALLAGTAAVPWLIEIFSGHPVAAWLRASTVPLGQLLPGPSIGAALVEGGHGDSARAAVAFAYRAQAWVFASSLVCIVAGTGLIKATVSSIIGKLYAPNDRRRDEGYSIFMAFVYLGAFLSNFVAGTLGERVGWHYGFAAAGVGMAGGLLWYLARQRQVLGDIGVAPDRKAREHSQIDAHPSQTAAERTLERGRIVVALVMSAFVILYAMSFYQKGGLLNLETRMHVDRHVFGFEVPATWLLSMSTLVFIVLTLPFTRLWRSLRARGAEPDAITKLALGLCALACGYLVLSGGLMEKAASPTNQFHIAWIIAMYSVFALGDLLVWPTQISAVSRLAPARYTAFAVGAWHLTIGIGSWLTAPIGAFGSRVGVDTVAYLLAGLCIAGAITLLVMRRPLLKLSAGAL